MELTFLGHQSWLASQSDTHLLIDPLLLDTFGHSKHRALAIYPPRKIYLEKFPLISAIVLSHEHLDHFHIPSLAELNRDIPVIIGEIFPAATKEAIEELGFKLRILRSSESMTIGDFRVSLYSAGSGTVNWERNVYQVFLQSASNSEDSTFIAVDALVSEEFLEDLERNLFSPPKLIVASNNSQVLPEGAYSSNTNLLPISSGEQSPLYRFKLITSILDQVPSAVEFCKNIAICGNGYHDPRQKCGPFLHSDNKELARAAESLCAGVKVVGPYPGERIYFKNGEATLEDSGLVFLNVPEYERLLKQGRDYMSGPSEASALPILEPYKTSEEVEAAILLCADEFQDLARAILISELGTHLFSIREYLGSRLGDRRLVIFIDSGPCASSIAAVLSFSTRKFHFEKLSFGECVARFPCGIQVFLRDLVGLLTGEFQVWEMLSGSSRTWYVGDKYNNIPAFLISFYGEHHNQTLAKRIYGPLIDDALRLGERRSPAISGAERGSQNVWK